MTTKVDWINERGLRGPLARVVHVYTDDRPDDAYTFATVNDDHWYSVTTDAKPGDYFDAVPEQREGSRTMPMAMAFRFILHLGRVVEVRA